MEHNPSMAVPKEFKEYFRKLGAKGGKAKAEKLTDAQRKQIGKQLAEARAKARKRNKKRRPSGSVGSTTREPEPERD
jgi:hypothetical protein